MLNQAFETSESEPESELQSCFNFFSCNQLDYFTRHNPINFFLFLSLVVKWLLHGKMESALKDGTMSSLMKRISICSIFILLLKLLFYSFAERANWLLSSLTVWLYSIDFVQNVGAETPPVAAVNDPSVIFFFILFE